MNNLFTPLADSLALEMLDNINEGLKPKERYKAHCAMLVVTQQKSKEQEKELT